MTGRSRSRKSSFASALASKWGTLYFPWSVGIRGVTFFDFGNAWNLEDQFCKTTPAPQFSKLVSPCFSASSLGYLRTATGAGIRWFSPLGPLRFEWGFPLKPKPDEDTSAFEFTIGNSF